MIEFEFDWYLENENGDEYCKEMIVGFERPDYNEEYDIVSFRDLNGVKHKFPYDDSDLIDRLYDRLRWLEWLN